MSRPSRCDCCLRSRLLLIHALVCPVPHFLPSSLLINQQRETLAITHLVNLFHLVLLISHVSSSSSSPSRVIKELEDKHWTRNIMKCRDSRDRCSPGNGWPCLCGRQMLVVLQISRWHCHVSHGGRTGSGQRGSESGRSLGDNVFAFKASERRNIQSSGLLQPACWDKALRTNRERYSLRTSPLFNPVMLWLKGVVW